MTTLDLIKLSPLIARATARPEVTIGLIDGPVAKGHRDLERERISFFDAPGFGEPLLKALDRRGRASDDDAYPR